MKYSAVNKKSSGLSAVFGGGSNSGSSADEPVKQPNSQNGRSIENYLMN